MNKLLQSLFGCFLLFSVTTFAQNIPTIENALTRYEAVIEKIKTEGRFLESLSLENPISFPIGIKKNLGGAEFLMVIDSMSISPGGDNFLRAFMKIEIPGKDKSLFFKADNIRFTKGGIASGAKLSLVNDVTIDFGPKIALTIRGTNDQTYVTLGCEGYESMNIDCQIAFDRSLIIPEDAAGNIVAGEKIKADFVRQIVQFNELLIKISLPSFQIEKLPGFSFKLLDATLDLSDVSNSPDFPATYQNQNMDAANSPLWQGVYVRELEVMFPPNIKSTDNKRTTINAKQLIIDAYGISGKFSGSKLLSLDKGVVGSWAFSLDSAYLDLKSNHVEQANFNGKIVSPIFDKKTPLKYKAIIQTGGEYVFQVSSLGELSMDMWAAKVTLAPNSSLEIKVVNKEFYPKATLNGSVSVSLSKGSNVSLADLRFEELVIQRKTPVLSVKAFEISSDAATQKMSSFPISLKELGHKLPNLDAGLNANVRVNLVGKGGGGFAAEGGFTIWSELKIDGLNTSFKYKDLDINSLAIDIKGGAFSIKGKLTVYKEDAVYGNGFRGDVDFEMLEKFKIAASCQFGTIRNFRYYYVDALMVVPGGLPVFTGFAIYGFGGGIYSHMRQQASGLPAFGPQTATQIAENKAGASASGISYIPDEDVFLGIKASVVVGTHPTPDALNGDATFEISFNKDGGVKQVSIQGNAYFMKPSQLAGATGATSMVSASMYIVYDFTNATLYGNLQAYVNVAELVKGTGPNNKAGEVVMYFSKDKWYIYIGRPEKEQRIGLNIVGLFKINSYFCMGTEIPDIPKPDFDISAIIGKDVYGMQDDLSGRTGGGFVFGSSATFSTGDLTFLAFYASFNAGLGFDAMLKNYGTAIRCNGSDSPLGINGWYAKGQAYAYLQGKVGIKVDLAVVKGSFEILEFNAAAMLQAKLPNPTWLKGNVGGNYSILNGLLKGQCSFEFQVGTQCELYDNNPLAGVKIIAETTPNQNEKKVDVFVSPQAAFNLPVGTSFPFKDNAGNNRTFKLELDVFKILNNGEEVGGKKDWNGDKNVIAILPTDMLEQKKTHTFHVKVVFYEQINNKWEKIMVDGRAACDSVKYTFETGDAPTYIAHKHIAYAYPMLNQYNLYTQESATGYIVLKQGGWGPLLTPKTDFRQAMRFTADNNTAKEATISYDNASKRISFSIPSDLPSDRIHHYDIVNIPTKAALSIDKNVSNVTTKAMDKGKNTVNVETKDIEGNIQKMEENNIFESFFRTSKYPTFTVKMNAITKVNSYEVPLLNVQGIDEIGNNYRGSELFSAEELSNVAPSISMIRFEAKENNVWFSTYNNPIIYTNYPNHSLEIANRSISTLGTKPLKAINMRQSGANSLDDNGVITSQTLPADFANLIYNLDYYVGRDYFELRDKAAEYARRNGSSAWLSRIITSYYTGLFRDNYEVKASYYLPGSTAPNSETTISINTLH